MSNTIRTLETLYKVSEKKAEDIQKEISKLIAVMQEMDERERTLLTSMDTEYETASASHDSVLLQFAGRYSERAKDEINDICAARASAIKILAEKRENLRVQFAEGKRYEILLDRKKAEIKREQDKKEQALLDEVAGVRSSS